MVVAVGVVGFVAGGGCGGRGWRVVFLVLSSSGFFCCLCRRCSCCGGGECVLMQSAGFMIVGVGGGVKFVGVSACFSFRCGFGWVLLSAGASGFVACVRVWCGYCCWLMMVSRWRSVSTVATSCSLIMVCPHCGQVMPRCWRAWLAGMGCVLCPQWSHLGVMVVMSAVHVAWAPHLGQVMVCPGVAVFWSCLACLACWLVSAYGACWGDDGGVDGVVVHGGFPLGLVVCGCGVCMISWLALAGVVVLV